VIEYLTFFHHPKNVIEYVCREEEFLFFLNYLEVCLAMISSVQVCRERGKRNFEIEYLCRVEESICFKLLGLSGNALGGAGL